LQTIAARGRVLVLFTYAVGLNFTGVKRSRCLIRLVLGPGTLLTAAVIAVAAWAVLGLAPGFAAILGAALASTDPVMMRGLLRGAPDVPADARQALALESGLNDLVLLPIVLIAIAVLNPSGATGSTRSGTSIIGKRFIIGPAAGTVIGCAGVARLERLGRWWGGR